MNFGDDDYWQEKYDELNSRYSDLLRENAQLRKQNELIRKYMPANRWFYLDQELKALNEAKP